MVPDVAQGVLLSSTHGRGGTPIVGVQRLRDRAAEVVAAPVNPRTDRLRVLGRRRRRDDWLTAEPNTGELRPKQFHVRLHEDNTFVGGLITPFGRPKHGCDWAGPQAT